MKQHLEYQCVHRLLKCPKARFGCTYEAPRGEMQHHLERFDHTKFAFNLLEAMAEDAKVREDAYAEKIARLEGMLERTTEALSRQQTSMTLLSTNVGELRDSNAATQSSVTSLRAAVTSMQHDTAACVDRLWRASNGRTGTNGIPIGPGSRAGGSARQGRERRQVVRQQSTIRSLQGEIDGRDRAAAANAAAAGVGGVGGVGGASRRRRDEDLFDEDSGSGSDVEEIPLRNVRQRGAGD